MAAMSTDTLPQKDPTEYDLQIERAALRSMLAVLKRDEARGVPEHPAREAVEEQLSQCEEAIEELDDGAAPAKTWSRSPDKIGVGAAAYFRDGKGIAVGWRDGTVESFDVATGERSVATLTGAGHDASLR
jgi:hypothetical protein